MTVAEATTDRESRKSPWRFECERKENEGFERKARAVSWVLGTPLDKIFSGCMHTYNMNFIGKL
jgi:hypothetical protein